MANPRNPSRRDLFRLVGAGGATYALARTATAAPASPPAAAPASRTPVYAFFTPAEARFIEAAVARLIPSDALGGGAVEAGVPHFIDRQLAGAWGAGERLYRTGPWREGEETQGYQLPFSPAELFRQALRAIDADLAARGGFAKLAPAQQDEYLKALEEGKVKLAPVPAKTFFQHLLDITREGFFCDPAHGGNHGMIGWRLVGFPGAYANYYDTVDRWNMVFRPQPISMLSHGSGHSGGHGHPSPPAPPGKR